MAAGGWHSVGLKSNGLVTAVGKNYFGQLEVGSWTDIIQVAAGYEHTLGLKYDGTVVAVGRNGYGECDLDDWTDIVQLTGGDSHSVGVKSDGTVVAAGSNVYGQCDVDSWTDIVQVAAGHMHTVGVKSDGTVLAVGNYIGDFSSWTNIVQVSVLWEHTVGLRSDGSVVAGGYCTNDKCDVSGWNLLPESFITVSSPNGVEEMSAGETFEITWSYEGDIEYVKIEYSVNDGADWITITTETENDGSYDWEIPCDFSDESLVRISDVDSDVSDESDEVFSIIDDSPPSVEVFVDIDHLWPPNHRIVDVGFDYSVTDNCDAEADISIEITSDEPTATAPGAGGSKHAPDAEINDSVLLRAERSGESDGRVYQIVVTATDESGNSVSEAVNVKVNKSRKEEAIDSGQIYDAAEIN